MSVKHTGVVGLGAMGYQMARHMVAKGFDVAGYDVAAEAMTRAKAAGVKTVGSVADVGESAESSSSWSRPTSRWRTWS